MLFQDFVLTVPVDYTSVISSEHADARSYRLDTVQYKWKERKKRKLTSAN